MRRILIAIADDHLFFRETLRRLLVIDPELYLVGEAGNGLEAVDVVDTYRPDVILMDINMPIMDGFEATKIITSKYPSTKVIILSFHSDDGFRVRAQESGACHFLSKDSSPSSIITTWLGTIFKQ